LRSALFFLLSLCLILSGCSKSRPVESASLTTIAGNYSYVEYENGKIENKNKNDYEEIQSQIDFINLACDTARFFSERAHLSPSTKLTSSSTINLLDFVNKPLSLALANIEILSRGKLIKLSQAKEKLSKIREIPALKFQSTINSYFDSGDLWFTSNQGVLIQDGRVNCVTSSLRKGKNYKKD